MMELVASRALLMFRASKKAVKVGFLELIFLITVFFITFGNGN